MSALHLLSFLYFQITYTTTLRVTPAPTTENGPFELYIFYNESNADYWKQHTSEYDDIIQQAVFDVFQNLTRHSLDYNDRDQYYGFLWSYGGITEWKTCMIFNTKITPITDHCPTIPDPSSKYAEYVAVIQYYVVSDGNTDSFQSYVLWLFNNQYLAGGTVIPSVFSEMVGDHISGLAKLALAIQQLNEINTLGSIFNRDLFSTTTDTSKHNDTFSVQPTPTSATNITSVMSGVSVETIERNATVYNTTNDVTDNNESNPDSYIYEVIEVTFVSFFIVIMCLYIGWKKLWKKYNKRSKNIRYRNVDMKDHDDGFGAVDMNVFGKLVIENADFVLSILDRNKVIVTTTDTVTTFTETTSFAFNATDHSHLESAAHNALIKIDLDAMYI